jgi:TPR repeat protein
MYAQGLGVAQDKNAAVKWFRTAAGLGHAGAENALDNLVSATASANVI